MSSLFTAAGNAIVDGSVHNSQFNQALIFFVCHAAVDNLLAVTLADAKSGLADRINGFHHCGTASCDIAVTHGQSLHRRFNTCVFTVDTLNQVSWGTDFLQCRSHNVYCLHRDLHRSGVRQNDNRVSALQSHHGIADDSSNRICAGHYGTNYTHGLGQILDAGFAGTILVLH